MFHFPRNDHCTIFHATASNKKRISYTQNFYWQVILQVYFKCHTVKVFALTGKKLVANIYNKMNIVKMI